MDVVFETAFLLPDSFQATPEVDIVFEATFLFADSFPTDYRSGHGGWSMVRSSRQLPDGRRGVRICGVLSQLQSDAVSAVASDRHDERCGSSNNDSAIFTGHLRTTSCPSYYHTERPRFSRNCMYYVTGSCTMVIKKFKQSPRAATSTLVFEYSKTTRVVSFTAVRIARTADRCNS